MRRDHAKAVGWQAERLQQRPVPADQFAVLVIDTDAQPDGVERCLQHRAFLRHFARAFAGVLGLDLGDVGVDADNAPFTRTQFVDLHPAPVGERVDIAAVGDPVLLDALGQPAIGRDHRTQSRPVVANQLRDLVEAHSGSDLIGNG